MRLIGDRNRKLGQISTQAEHKFSEQQAECSPPNLGDAEDQRKQLFGMGYDTCLNRPSWSHLSTHSVQYIHNAKRVAANFSHMKRNMRGGFWVSLLTLHHHITHVHRLIDYGVFQVKFNLRDGRSCS